MASPMQEDVQVSSPAEAASPEKAVVELPAPEGWKKKLIPKRRCDEIVYYAPTGDMIKSRAQLERYLKSHPGGPASSDFNWTTGTTPRRSSRLSDKMQVDSETPESDSKKTPPKRSRKSGAADSEDTKSSKKKNKSEAASEENETANEEGMQEDVEHGKESIKEVTDPETVKEDDEGQKEEEQQVKQDDKVEEFKAEDVEIQKTDEIGEDKEADKELNVEKEGEPIMESEVHMEEDKVATKEPGVHVKEEKSSKEPEVHVEDEKSSKEPEVHVEEEKSTKEPEVHLEEEKQGKESEIEFDENIEKEPLVQTGEDMPEGVKTDLAEEAKSVGEEAHGNGVDIESKVPTYAEPQEPVDMINENGHDRAIFLENYEQHKPVEATEETSHDLKDTTQDATKIQFLQTSNNSEAHQPSEQLGVSS